MTIDFYKVNDVKNKINKTLSVPYTISNVFFKSGNVDVVNPFLRLSRDITQYNYCFIRELNRFYFIDDVVIENNGIKNYKLTIDVLMSYKNEIINNKTHIVESENVLNVDNIEYSEKNNEIIKTFNFPENPFENNKTDVLICVRG